MTAPRVTTPEQDNEHFPATDPVLTGIGRWANDWANDLANNSQPPTDLAASGGGR
jgi:hypothetical protein